MLTEILEKIEQALAANYPKVLKSLQPGASDEEIAALKAQCQPKHALPDEIVTLYRWHNGQRGSYSLNPDDNLTFLPIKEAIEAWRFLTDPNEDILQPYSPSWIPLLHNGAGDYLVYETEGAHAGALIGYRHDDEKRHVKYPSVSKWAQEVLSVVEELDW